MNEHPKPHSPGGQRTGRVESSAAGAVVEGLRGRQAEGVRPEGGGTARFRTSVRNDKPGDADDDGYLDDPATSGDEWRVQRVYVNGQGQLGQIVKVIVYDYTGGNTTSTPYYYGYDVLGNVSVISDNAGDECQ